MPPYDINTQNIYETTNIPCNSKCVYVNIKSFSFLKMMIYVFVSLFLVASILEEHFGTHMG